MIYLEKQREVFLVEKVYVFGHRKPDTDSVCASISYSYLKNQLGENTTPRVLGHINQESKFVLDYFHVKEPEYLNSVKVQIRNIDYHKNFYANEYISVLDAIVKMEENNVTALPIVDSKKHFLNLVTIKELGSMIVKNSFNEKLNTSFQNILNALEGTEILRFSDEISGNVSIASYQSQTFFNEVELSSNDILIVGDRYKVLKYAIEKKVKCIVITGGHDIADDLFELAKKNKVSIISTPYHTFHAGNAIALSNYIKEMLTNKSPVTCNNLDYRTEFIDMANKIGHTNYPVVNVKNECLGLIKVTDVDKYRKQRVILVDHNGFSQSVDGIEEAQIEEIIDHHNLLNVGTPAPINFRSMPVGCTCTIIYRMFLENNVPIPKDIAGIMLSSILSDTLLLRSVTTTEEDKRVVEALAKIAEVDPLKYGHEMVKAGFSIKGKKAEDLITEDIKTFRTNNKVIGISQIFTMDYEDIKADMNNFLDKVDELAGGQYDIVIVLITDIEKNGSYLFYDRKSEEIVKEAINNEALEEGIYIQDLLSRKKQLVPNVMEVVERKF